MRGLNLFTLIAACSWWLLLVGCSDPTAAGPTVPLHDLFGVSPDRVISVGEMEGLRRGPGAFWLDNQPFVLKGCATEVLSPTIFGYNWQVLSQDGGFSKDRYLTDDAGTPPEGGELASYTDVGIQLNATTTSDRDIDGDGNPDSPGDGICP